MTQIGAYLSTFLGVVFNRVPEMNGRAWRLFGAGWSLWTAAGYMHANLLGAFVVAGAGLITAAYMSVPAKSIAATAAPKV